VRRVDEKHERDRVKVRTGKLTTTESRKKERKKERTRQIIETQKDMREVGRQSLNDMYIRKDRDKQTQTDKSYIKRQIDS
jgi:hypothetical protein